jgi:hypothetical protein
MLCLYDNTFNPDYKVGSDISSYSNRTYCCDNMTTFSILTLLETEGIRLLGDRGGRRSTISEYTTVRILSTSHRALTVVAMVTL